MKTSMQKQQGAALAVGMIMLLIITVIGFTAMKGTMLQEKMAASLHNRVMANSGANSALREAEWSLWQKSRDTNGLALDTNPELFNIYEIYQDNFDIFNYDLNSVAENFKTRDWSAAGGTEVSYAFDSEAPGSALNRQPEYYIQIIRDYQTRIGEDEGDTTAQETNSAEKIEYRSFLVSARSNGGDDNEFSLAQSIYTMAIE